jgi:recombination protein RecR
MPDFAEPIANLVEQLKRLPGIGQKTAQRLAFHLLRADREESESLAAAILAAKNNLHECSVCNNVTDTDPCLYCRNPARAQKTICVIEEPHNIVPVEKTRAYNGLYHVLGGTLSPLNGVGPDQLKIKSLLERLTKGTVEVIIIAPDPTTEGEATAVYLSKLIKPLGVRVTRIGMGIPVGSDLEYADEVTMSKAMEGRREL